MSTLDTIRAVVRECEAGRRSALCAIVATRGSTPQPAGTIVAVDETAAMTGTLGGGCVEADVRRRAHALLDEAATGGDSSPADSAGKLLTFELDNDFGYDDGMICGGQMDIAVAVFNPSSELAPLRAAVTRLEAGREAQVPLRVCSSGGLVEYRLQLEAEPKLVIVGAGHISRAIAVIADSIGFSIDVIDDRSDYANADRFPPPMHTTVGDITTTLDSWPIDGNTYIVIVTRGHVHDEGALRAVLDSPAKYIGMIGSRRKVEVIFDDLRHEGADEESLNKVHAPIGVRIGAVTAGEIAVSIAAELIAARRERKRSAVEGPIALSGDAQ